MSRVLGHYRGRPVVVDGDMRRGGRGRRFVGVLRRAHVLVERQRRRHHELVLADGRWRAAGVCIRVGTRWCVSLARAGSVRLWLCLVGVGELVVAVGLWLWLLLRLGRGRGRAGVRLRPPGLGLGDHHAEYGSRRQVGVGQRLAGDRLLQADGARVLVRLLALQGHLLGHDALALGDQVALGAVTVAELAVALVALEPADDSVVPAAGALRPARGGRGRRAGGARGRRTGARALLVGAGHRCAGAAAGAAGARLVRLVRGRADGLGAMSKGRRARLDCGRARAPASGRRAQVAPGCVRSARPTLIGSGAAPMLQCAAAERPRAPPSQAQAQVAPPDWLLAARYLLSILERLAR